MTDAENEETAVLLVADDDAAAEQALRAVDIARCGPARRIGWKDLTASVADEGGIPPIVMLEAAQVSDDLLLDALPPFAVLARDRGVEIVATIDTGQMDVVTPSLLNCRAQVLCGAVMGDRVGALLIASSKEAGAIGFVAESDAERLARINAEVARIADVLTRLIQRDAPPAPDDSEVQDRRPAFHSEPPREIAITAGDIRGVIRARRMRDRFFGANLFEDPAWDMLLDLFATHLEHAQVSVSSLCIASAVAPTTALRWIGRLAEFGLIERAPDPTDRRRAFLALSVRGLDAMRQYIAATRAAGFAIA